MDDPDAESPVGVGRDGLGDDASAGGDLVKVQLEGLLAEDLDEPRDRRRVRFQVGEDLTQRGLLRPGGVDGAELLV